MYELKIPKGRIACLIGKNGITKKAIEKTMNVKLKIYNEGDVEIYGEGYNGYVCEKIVKAISRGFNPNIALSLTNDDYALEIINIKDYSGNSKKKFIRIKSRLIGKNGKARKVVEILTGCYVCIYGKTISLIGEYEKLDVAYRGIDKLLNGSTHGKVYAFLEREMKKLRKDSFD